MDYLREKTCLIWFHAAIEKTCLIWFQAAIEILVAQILCDVLRLNLFYYVAGSQEQITVGDNENEDLL